MTNEIVRGHGAYGNRVNNHKIITAYVFMSLMFDIARIDTC